MPRFIVRYHTIKDKEKTGCCKEPFSRDCASCENWCLHVTTTEAENADQALLQTQKFCSDGAGFTVESATAEKAGSPIKFTDKRWPYLRKDD